MQHPKNTSREYYELGRTTKRIKTSPAHFLANKNQNTKSASFGRYRNVRRVPEPLPRRQNLGQRGRRGLSTGAAPRPRRAAAGELKRVPPRRPMATRGRTLLVTTQYT
ncbi:hypothetical protein EVAR_97684_1 [Eumeta japonica]|uniref:Uncharacterized protein n=1 Tax=Eumeta variegata TaxID=151549 RepID=A0A4C1WYL5_EUMVA|nr:hypothetical protein EVAR_97684_1 [Eumeta japonica]